MKTLQNLLFDELTDMYDAERRIVKALPKLSKAATCTRLQKAFQLHLKESEGHVKKLEQVFKSINEKAKGQMCEATVGLLQEADEVMDDFKGSPAINAALICVAQKVEHYEIATYGCLHEWAGLLGYKEAAGLFEQILTEEKGANDLLNELAHSSLNREALGTEVELESPMGIAKPAGKPARSMRTNSPSRNRAFAIR